MHSHIIVCVCVCGVCVCVCVCVCACVCVCVLTGQNQEGSVGSMECSWASDRDTIADSAVIDTSLLQRRTD